MAIIHLLKNPNATWKNNVNEYMSFGAWILLLTPAIIFSSGDTNNFHIIWHCLLEVLQNALCKSTWGFHLASTWVPTSTIPTVFHTIYLWKLQLKIFF